MENEDLSKEQLQYDIDAFIHTFGKSKGSPNSQFDLLLKGKGYIGKYYTPHELAEFDEKRIGEIALGLYPVFEKQHGTRSWANTLNYQERVGVIKDQISQQVDAANILITHISWRPYQAIEKVLKDLESVNKD